MHLLGPNLINHLGHLLPQDNRCVLSVQRTLRHTLFLFSSMDRDNTVGAEFIAQYKNEDIYYTSDCDWMRRTFVSQIQVLFLVRLCRNSRAFRALLICLGLNLVLRVSPICIID